MKKASSHVSFASDDGHNSFCEPPGTTISFAAAGWMQTFHFGVAKAIQDLGIDDHYRFVGTSAGALASASLTLKCDFDEIRDYALECAAHCHQHWTHAFRIRHYVQGAVAKFAVAGFHGANAEDPASPLNTRTEVYATVLPWCRQKIFTQFDNVDDLEEALCASCCLTPLAGLPFQLRKTGEWVCDGGMSAFQPRNGEPGVITVSPLYFTAADIRPCVYVPVWWGLYPPGQDQYRMLFSIGYNSAIRYFMSEGVVNGVKGRAMLHDISINARGEPCSPRETASPSGRHYVRWANVSHLWSMTKDLLVVGFFLLILRPCAMLLILADMFLSNGVCFAKAVLHDILPTRSNRTRRRAWSDLYHSWRNTVSLRGPLRVLFGPKVPANEKRLSKFSLLYRLLYPILHRGHMPEEPKKSERTADHIKKRKGKDAKKAQ